MNDRRGDDPRIAQLVEGQAHQHDCIEALKMEMRRNTAVTEDMRDILTSFKMVGRVAKWITTIVGAVAATVAAVKAWK